jgi:hypothetical protein
MQNINYKWSTHKQVGIPTWRQLGGPEVPLRIVLRQSVTSYAFDHSRRIENVNLKHANNLYRESGNQCYLNLIVLLFFVATFSIEIFPSTITLCTYI